MGDIRMTWRLLKSSRFHIQYCRVKELLHFLNHKSINHSCSIQLFEIVLFCYFSKKIGLGILCEFCVDFGSTLLATFPAVLGISADC